jgi:hypothetical protein
MHEPRTARNKIINEKSQTPLFMYYPPSHHVERFARLRV